MNVAVVAGVLEAPVSIREVASGEPVAAFDLRVVNRGRSESVPVSWPTAPTSITRHEPGDELVVMGRVRRRFFRAAGSVQSRTELVASSVVAGGQKKRVERLLTAAATELWPGPERS